MDKWHRSSDLPLAIAGVGLILGALIGGGMPWGTTFVSFALLIAVSELFEVTLPNDAHYSLGLAPAIGYVLLGDPTVAGSVVAYGVGGAIAIGIRAGVRRPMRIAETSMHLTTIAVAAVLYRGLERIDEFPRFVAGTTRISALGFAVALIAILLLEAFLHANRAAMHARIPLLPAVRSQIGSTAALHLSIMSVGALVALAYPTVGFWAFPLFLAPLGATQFAYRQFASIRTTYLQTIRALSKVPETAGYTHPGHSTRVADLATGIAQELGVGTTAANEIEYASLLHDIGRVSIPDPLADTDTIPQTEIATIGATIVRQTGHFPRVADMIERQHEPYRHKGEDASPDLPVGAKIIRVASAYDDLTRPGGMGLSSWDAIDRLHHGMAHDYDPAVIQALTRLLEKRGVL